LKAVRCDVPLLVEDAVRILATTLLMTAMLANRAAPPLLVDAAASPAQILGKPAESDRTAGSRRRTIAECIKDGRKRGHSRKEARQHCREFFR
jgi:hypothetical protein